MSWIDKELKKRAAESAKASVLEHRASTTQEESETSKISYLWGKFQSINSSFPNEIQLLTEKAQASFNSPGYLNVSEWLRARNGAALGFTDTAIRYTWPEKSLKKSKNFWVRWNVERQCYLVIQRAGSTVPPAVNEYRFDDNRIEYMLKCLITNKRIKPQSMRRRRFWLF